MVSMIGNDVPRLDADRGTRFRIFPHENQSIRLVYLVCTAEYSQPDFTGT